jgi:phage replication O-like protein O
MTNNNSFGANPQLEDGYTQIANEIIEAIYNINLNSYENRVLWFVLRMTYGWKQKSDTISLSQFENGVVSKGTLIIKGTAIKRNKICDAIESLCKRNIIIRSHAQYITEYSFQKDYTKWIGRNRCKTSDQSVTTHANVLPTDSNGIANGLPKDELTTNLPVTYSEITPNNQVSGINESEINGNQMKSDDSSVQQDSVCGDTTPNKGSDQLVTRVVTSQSLGSDQLVTRTSDQLVTYKRNKRNVTKETVTKETVTSSLNIKNEDNVKNDNNNNVNLLPIFTKYTKSFQWLRDTYKNVNINKEFGEFAKTHKINTISDLKPFEAIVKQKNTETKDIGL